ncbi:MAG: 30S ribosomal protein S5 [Elusimicrobia bacterium]|nr:30S ribosomal protein S5 [Elusimicrobiota bacterium]
MAIDQEKVQDLEKAPGQPEAALEELSAQTPRELPLQERVVTINRVSKVVKGGKRFSFTALVVVGDGEGRVGSASGKARDVQSAIRKAAARARKSLISFPLSQNQTIPYEVIGHFGASRVWLKPAAPGTGVIAAGGVRAILESGGIRNILTKNLGSSNPYNVVYATLNGLVSLRTKEQLLRARGKQ